MIPICKRFVSDDQELDAVLIEAKSSACPHCREVGTLLGHGKLRGYSCDGPGQVVRGRRLLCSDRHRRRGCGRTISVLVSAFMRGFVASTLRLSRILADVALGRSVPRAGGGLSRRSGYRLRKRLRHAGSRIRTALLGVCAPPPTKSQVPEAQLLAHLQAVFGTAKCVLASLQRRFQTGLLA